MREHITFGFVGIGLIGGSVAKALRRVYPSCKIIVYNRSAEPRVMAINDGTMLLFHKLIKLLMSVIIFFFALLLKKMLNI